MVPQGGGVAGGEANEKLTQMDYLQCQRWVWSLPTPTPAVLNALLK